MTTGNVLIFTREDLKKESKHKFGSQIEIDDFKNTGVSKEAATVVLYRGLQKTYILKLPIHE